MGGVAHIKMPNKALLLNKYSAAEGETIYLLLCGGDKSSQKKDIKRAHDLAEKYREFTDE
jgi:putative addiction module killer protein